MTEITDPARPSPVRSRREALGLLGAGLAMLGLAPGPARAEGEATITC